MDEKLTNKVAVAILAYEAAADQSATLIADRPKSIFAVVRFVLLTH